MDVNAIRAALLAVEKSGDCASLQTRLRAEEPGELFNALFPIATAPQADGPAYRAAKLLIQMNPSCQLSPTDAVRRMLDGWDVSLEEVPLYLAKQFGKASIARVVALLRKEFLEGEQEVRLRTITYWLEVGH